MKNEKGNVVKVNFGDPNMKIKKSDQLDVKVFVQDIIGNPDLNGRPDIGHVKLGKIL